jgi:hypothetical protein
MRYSFLAALAATAIVTTACSASPADPRAKKRTQYRVALQTPSLDGRITGRPRTCGHEMFQYGPGGAPHGPYCH